MTALAISNVVLWIAVLALLFVVLALVRQIGVLHERIAPMGAMTSDHGPAVGELAPSARANASRRAFEVGPGDVVSGATVITR